MKKLIALAFLTFALVASTVAVMTIHPQPGFADPNGGGGGGNGG